MVLATFNTRGMSTEYSPHTTKMQELIHFCITEKIDIMAIQEHKVTFTNPSPPHTRDFTLDRWLFKYSSAMGLQGGGVGWLIAPHLIPHIESTETVHPRILSVHLLLGTRKVTLVCIYAPHASLPHDVVAGYYSTLSTYLTSIPHSFVVVGDCNAVVKPKVDGPFGYTGPLGTDAAKAAGELELFIYQHGLCVYDTRCNKPRFHTYYGAGRRVPLDHAMLSPHFKCSQFNFSAKRGPFPSDHRVVTYRIPLMRPRPHRRPARALPPDCSQLLKANPDSPVKDNFLTTYKQHLGTAPPTYETIASALRIAEGVLPRRIRLARLNPRTHTAIAAIREEVATAPSYATMRAHFRRLTLTREHIRNAEVGQFCAMFNDLVNTEGRKAFEAIRVITRRSAPTGAIKATSIPERLERIRTFAATQLQNPLGSTSIHFPRIKGLTAQAYNTAPFDATELQKAIATLGNNKSPGPDGIRNEFLKVMGQDLLPLFNNFLTDGTVPSTVKQTLLAMIPKSGGNLSEPKGWRFIALMNTVAKLYDRLLLGRTRPIILPYMRPNQAGFLPQRSTIQQAMALKMIIEHINHHKSLTGVVTFIDFVNAFPSITWVSIKAALEAYHVPEMLVNAILSIYHNHQTIVRTNDGDTAPFEPSAGVLQGDTLAPFLFDLVIDCIMRQAVDNQRHNGITIGPMQTTDLDYADDIALISPDIPAAQSLLTAVEKYALRCGLDINITKTKYMLLGERVVGPQWTLFVKGKAIENVTDYRYLGCYMDTDADMTARKGQAWKIMRDLRNVWGSPRITKCNKVRLWRTLVEPILTYGAPTYTLTDGRTAALNGMVTRMLKVVLGIPMEQHTSLHEVYGTSQLRNVLTNQIPSALLTTSGPTLDIPHISTTIMIRQMTLIARTFQAIPNHPLCALITHETQAKLKASRQWSLRNTIESYIDFPIQNFPAFSNDPDWRNYIYERAQQFELRAYGLAARAHMRAKLRQRLAQLVSENAPLLAPANEDVPIPEMPMTQLNALRHLESKITFLHQLLPTQFPTPEHFLAPLRELKIVPPPISNATTATVYTFAISRTARAAGDTNSDSELDEAHAPMEASGMKSYWAAAFHQPHSTINHRVAVRASDRTVAELDAITSTLANNMQTNLVIITSNKVFLTKRVTLPRQYYHRMLRKHILWKTIHHLVRQRTATGIKTTVVHASRRNGPTIPQIATRFAATGDMPRTNDHTDHNAR